MKDLSSIHISALRSVEAAARLGTLRAAADELGVTPGAVSQQIIKAEAQLDTQLFDRTPKGLVPTTIGTEVMAHLSEGFTALARAVSVTQRGRDDAITVSVAPVFAAKWLVWRLGRFAERHPGIQVRIDASVTLVKLRPGEVDASIRVGTGNWPGVRAEELAAQRVFPVCAPALAAQLNDLSDLTNVPIIRERNNTMFGWDAWLAPNDMSKDQLRDGPVFSDASLCLDAAAAGQGVYLGLEALAEDALAAGRLVAPFPGRFASGVSYWFLEPEDRRRSVQLEAFRAWLVAEMRRGS